MKPQPNPERLKLRNVVLFNENDSAPNSLTPNTISLSKIVLPNQQPRRYFDPEKMFALVESVRQHGILEPILLRSLDNDTYELVAGERRYRAAKEVGLDAIPAVVRQMTPEEALQIALVENLQREDINPVEETEAILQLLVLKLNLSIDEVTAQLYRMRHITRGEIGQNVLTSPEYDEAIVSVFSSLGFKWESFITSRLPLLKLPSEILDVLRQGRIEYTKALAISRIKDEISRQELLNQAIEQGLSLVQIRELIAVLPQSQSSKHDQNKLKIQVDTALRALKKSNVWSDPKKQKRLEKLMQEIESLISGA
ncbi:MAG: ParB/RepB/Spo0J family partition protein [Pseudanabaena sp. ELA645]|jgi:ParB family chromosome partitioning protein